MTLNEALASEEIAKKFEDAGSMDEVLAILKEYGVDATEEELMNALADETGELSEDQLENVSGGLLLINPLLKLGAKAILRLIKNKTIKPTTLPKAILKMLGLG